MLGGAWRPNHGIGRIIVVIGGHKSISDCLLGDWPMLPPSPAPKHISSIKKLATLKLVQSTEKYQ